MSRQIVVRIPDDLYEDLVDVATKNERTVAQEVRHRLKRRYLFTPLTGSDINPERARDALLKLRGEVSGDQEGGS